MAFDLITTDAAGMPAFLQELGGYQDEGLSAGIQPRAPKIGISIDKHFTITRDGVSQILETVMTDNTGTEHRVPMQRLRCVIVAASQTTTKAWYEQAYVPGSNAAPECYSNDGKTPAPGVAKPQCSSCLQCNKNIFGTSNTGRGKACSDRKMLVVAWEGAPDELMTWNVSTTSLPSLAKFNQELKNANIPMQSVLVELVFDPTIQYPVVKISAVGFVDKATFLKFKEASQTDEVAALLREVDYEPAVPADSPVPNNQIKFGEQAQQPAPQQTQQQAPQEQAQQPAQEQPKRTRRTKAQIEAGRAAAASQQPVQQQQAPVETQQPEPQQEQAQQPVNNAQADMVAQLQAQLAAALAAQQTPQVQQPVQEAMAQLAVAQEPVVQQQTQQAAPQQTQQAAAAPSANVANLLSQWASKK